MKKVLLAAMFAVVVSGAVFAEGGAMAELKLNAPRSADSISFETPKAAPSDSLNELAKLQAETGVQGSNPYEILKKLYAKGIPAV